MLHWQRKVSANWHMLPQTQIVVLLRQVTAQGMTALTYLSWLIKGWGQKIVKGRQLWGQAAACSGGTACWQSCMAFSRYATTLQPFRHTPGHQLQGRSAQ
mmetsp:Transcript_118479/g.330525  ORF Transcript_118479/g.330525 Transcript_118479/m.330525 type:complete len:100 (+) Transcript_118479:2398-2697(+)